MQSCVISSSFQRVGDLMPKIAKALSSIEPNNDKNIGLFSGVCVSSDSRGHKTLKVDLDKTNLPFSSLISQICFPMLDEVTDEAVKTNEDFQRACNIASKHGLDMTVQQVCPAGMIPGGIPLQATATCNIALKK